MFGPTLSPHCLIVWPHPVTSLSHYLAPPCHLTVSLFGPTLSPHCLIVWSHPVTSLSHCLSHPVTSLSHCLVPPCHLTVSLFGPTLSPHCLIVWSHPVTSLSHCLVPPCHLTVSVFGPTLSPHCLIVWSHPVTSLSQCLVPPCHLTVSSFQLYALFTWVVYKCSTQTYVKLFHETRLRNMSIETRYNIINIGLSSIYNAALKRKARPILYDPTHPLNDAFQEASIREMSKSSTS